MKNTDNKQDSTKMSPANNSNKQGVDKAPGEEKSKKEKVTVDDLKGKSVDEDPSTEEGKPLERAYKHEA